MSNPTTTNMEAYWSLDETSGTRVDSHGSNDLTDNNTVGFGTGVQGNAGDFETSNSEYLSIADNASLSLSSDTSFSFVLWVKPETAISQYVLDKSNVAGGANAVEYRIQMFTDNKVYCYIGDGSSNASVTSTDTITAGSWGMITYIHDAVNNEIKTSVNGGSFDTTAWSNGTQDLATAFALGGLNTGATTFDGLIDEVAFFKDRVLSQAEIEWLYNSGSGRTYSEIVGAVTSTPTAGVLTLSQVAPNKVFTWSAPVGTATLSQNAPTKKMTAKPSAGLLTLSSIFSFILKMPVRLFARPRKTSVDANSNTTDLYAKPRKTSVKSETS